MPATDTTAATILTAKDLKTVYELINISEDSLNAQQIAKHTGLNEEQVELALEKLARALGRLRFTTLV